MRQRVAASPDELLGELDSAVSSVDLEDRGRPAWWSVAKGIQAVLATVAILGFLWLSLLFALEWLQIPRPPTPQVEEIPWPTIALIGGLLAGLLFSFLFQQIARLGARRRRRRAKQRLREGVERVASQRVLSPLQSELETYVEFCKAVGTMRGGRLKS